MPLRVLLPSLYKSIREKWIPWNLFDSRTTDPLIIRREILSTRLYIILVLVSLIILTTYASLSQQNETKTVLFPSESVYKNLLKTYTNNLQCTCTKVLIPYEKFVKTNPSFHQVCSSDFISQKWIDFIFKADSTLIWPIDVRTSLSSMWQLIRTFCQNAKTTVLNAFKQFNNSRLITSILLNEELLETKVSTTLNFLYRTISSNLIQSRKIIERITQANELMTGLLTNYIVVTDKFRLSQLPNDAFVSSTVNISAYIGIFANKYISKNSTKICSCKNNGSCPLPGNIYLYHISEKFAIYDMNKIEINESLSGIIIDCLPIQMTLSSTLECFYNEICLNILLSSYSNKMNISILNQSLLTRFNPKTKIELLINQLFIENIFNQTNYSEYYLQCLPNICHYNYLNRFNVIYILTIFISLFGGISTILRAISPLIIQLFFFLKKRFCSKQIQEIQNQSENKIRLLKLFREIETKIINFNLYTKYSHNPIRIYHSILSTRLYIISMFISLCIIILSSNFVNQTIHETILNPSREEYEKLEIQYSSTLQCPCTQISIPYGDFLNVQVKYHQICSSDFIQSWWYQSFLPRNSSDVIRNFLSIASSHFQALSTFCDIVNITINDAIEKFLTRNFINSQLLSNDSFILQVNSLNNTFATLTRTEFLYRISLTNLLLHSNQYLSNIQMNTYLNLRLTSNSYREPMYISIDVNPRFGLNENDTECDCILDSTCSFDYKISQNGQRLPIDWQLEGIHGGCYIINSVLKSSMICWFKDTCLNQLRKIFYEIGVVIPSSITPLNSTLPSRYSPSTLIETIFNEMMIEEWNFSYSFDKFYHKCKPSFCSFTYEKEINIIYIITIIVSLMGGINTILKFISPVIIKISFKFISLLTHIRSSRFSFIQQTNHQNGGISNIIINLINRLKDALLMLNLFDSESNDVDTNYRERISTRIYLTFFLISIFIIIFYTISLNIIVYKSLSNPSENEYKNLLMIYSESLYCPCKNISIEYKYFLQIETKFHSICSSDFISKKWLKYLFLDKHWIGYDRRDIRVRGSAYFSFLLSLCKISETTIDNSINQFLNDVFINTQLITESQLEIQINSIILQFRNVTLEKFSESFKLLRDIMNGNAFISSYYLNWYWWKDIKHTFVTFPIKSVVMKDECSCATRSDCIDSGGIYRDSSKKQRFVMPGWNIGCSVVETLLSSTLECLYNQKCVDLLVFYLTSELSIFPYRINMSAMNFSNESHFKPDIYIQNISDELFVEEWKHKTSYSSFYHQCAPIYCSYKTKKDDYIIYTISKVLGLCGGLTIALRFTIPLIIKIIFQIRKKCRRNTIQPNE
ncbi:unnamed protein product [Adineta ricciae]|uniref:Uncharacterized protein n=1 Tax=Adineta ricciae TaxID=249248 RepID=A0A814T738_ADIRI|nr:unnamed protein product [Adineta ricciae]